MSNKTDKQLRAFALRYNRNYDQLKRVYKLLPVHARTYFNFHLKGSLNGADTDPQKTAIEAPADDDQRAEVRKGIPQNG